MGSICIATPPWFHNTFFYLMLFFFICGTVLNIPISRLLVAILGDNGDYEAALKYWSQAGMFGALMALNAAGCYYFFMYRPAMARLTAGIPMNCSETIYLLWGY